MKKVLKTIFVLRKPFHCLGFYGMFIFLLSHCSLEIPKKINQEMAGLPEEVDFNYHIKPILSDRCFKCHGPDENTRKAGLRLDVETLAFAKLASGKSAFSKGSIYRSEAAHRIISMDPEIQMPPPFSNLQLTEREKAMLLKWIEQGAKWKEHWSFTPSKKINASLLSIKNNKQIIDQFISDKLTENGLSFEVEATKETLIRRLRFDLTGIPPSILEIDVFLKDTLHGNYERLVDRLMASKSFAERLSLDWLDLSRYADSHGLHADGSRTMWPWRDWVIDAFEKNMPYDQFVTWQLAGDLLPNATKEQKLATAFNRNSPMTAEGGIIDEEWRLNYVFDRTETFSTAFLGLTVACAKCHDHKFDPISQKDYYQLSAFFNNIRELGMTGDDGDFGPLLYLPSENQQAQLKKLKTLIRETQTKIELSKKELAEVYQYIEKLPVEKELEKHLIGTYPFDKITPIRTRKNSTFVISNNTVVTPEYYISDNNRNVKSSQAPIEVKGIKGNAVQFKSDYDKISIDKEIPSFEWTDPFSVAIWINTEQKKENTRQYILGTTGGKNNWWRGWDFYLDDQNHVNFRLVNMSPGNMIHVRSTEAVLINQWTHLSFAYNGTGKANGVQLFKNGSPFATSTKINNLSKSIKPVSTSGMHVEQRAVLIGKTYEGSTGDNGLFKGKMDDLKIYDKSLSALEASLLFNQYAEESPAPEKGLMKEHWIQNHQKYTSLDKELRKNLGAWRETIDPVIEVMVMEELKEARTTYLYNRGNYAEPAFEVETITPGALPSMDKELPKNRLGLAQWLFKNENPLTARVAVNRYWQMIFGNGLVATPTDFGVQGSLPSHPELLDWLAEDFKENNWDVRALIKKMVQSKTYKQRVLFSNKKNTLDPNNILLARGNSKRLSAEMIRNNALSVSGLLSEKLGGPSVKPYQPKGLWKEKNTFSLRLLEYKESEGEDLYRRGIYTFIKRGSPPPSLITFDATSREICTIKRENTSSPLQSLVLLNDVQFFEASRVFAERIFAESKDTLEAQITYGFRLATSRFPEPQEIELMKELYQNQLAFYKKNKRQAYRVVNVGNSKFKQKTKVDKVAAMTIVANTLLNMNESYYKY
jgi:hypothetical protein|tara:strand:+ start:10165 stop:13464 length:3300 start_codon:yes stop_codon:yes gene_type:complete